MIYALVRGETVDEEIINTGTLSEIRRVVSWVLRLRQVGWKTVNGDKCCICSNFTGQ